MFGIIIRGIVALVELVLYIPVVAFAALLGVIATLYWGVKDGDWKAAEWDELAMIIKEEVRVIIEFVLDK